MENTNIVLCKLVLLFWNISVNRVYCVRMKCFTQYSIVGTDSLPIDRWSQYAIFASVRVRCTFRWHSCSVIQIIHDFKSSSLDSMPFWKSASVTVFSCVWSPVKLVSNVLSQGFDLWIAQKRIFECRSQIHA